jgi:NAD(P)-dependent dehydrogenase (short-subunit alcohol dehydrogenase family)
MTTIRITPAMVAAFRTASRDHNPLHADPEYARRTPFGRPVVFGVLGLLATLDRWLLTDPPGPIGAVRAVFRRPLFADEEYFWRAEPRADHVSLSLHRGPVEYLQARVVSATAAPAGPPPRPESEVVSYRSNPLDLRALIAAVGPGLRRLTEAQLTTLLWTSYWVGMVSPGERALFAELDLVFGSEPPEGELRLRVEPAQLDPRYNRLTQRGWVFNAQTSSPGRVALTSFIRPEPVAVDLGSVRAHSEGRSDLRGRRVFISGAARGFGAVLAATAAARGASLVLNYRTTAPDLLDILTGLGVGSDRCTLARADLTDAVAVEGMASQLAAGAPLDLVFLNATPPIRNALVTEQSAAELESFLTASVSMAVRPLRALLPLVAADGMIVLVSTVYLDRPERGFAHYLAAKAALEALLEGIALEEKGRRFVAARLPRMRTDQTNAPFDLHPPAAAEVVAARLLDRLAGLPGTPSFQRIHLGDG